MAAPNPSDVVQVFSDRASYVRVTWKATLLPAANAERYRQALKEFCQSQSPRLWLVGDPSLPATTDRTLGVGTVYIDATFRLGTGISGMRWGDLLASLNSVPVSFGPDLERTGADLQVAKAAEAPRNAVTSAQTSGGNAFDAASQDRSLADRAGEALDKVTGLLQAVAWVGGVTLVAYGTYKGVQFVKALK